MKTKEKKTKENKSKQKHVDKKPKYRFIDCDPCSKPASEKGQKGNEEIKNNKFILFYSIVSWRVTLVSPATAPI